MNAKRMEIEQEGDICIVRLIDKKFLDEQQIQRVGEELFDLLEKQGHRKIFVDFAPVEFISSAMLGKLITLYRKAAGFRAKVILYNICDEIREVLKITKLDKTTYVIVKDKEAALAALRQ